MNATLGPILPKICDWMLNKNYESHICTKSQTIGNRFQFPSFRHRVKAMTLESRTLPNLDLDSIDSSLELASYLAKSRCRSLNCIVLAVS